MSIKLESSGTSLKELVEKHGFGIKVKSTDRYCGCIPFTIKGDDPNNLDSFLVIYDDKENPVSVKKECRTTNDYVLFD